MARRNDQHAVDLDTYISKNSRFKLSFMTAERFVLSQITWDSKPIVYVQN